MNKKDLRKRQNLLSSPHDPSTIPQQSSGTLSRSREEKAQSSHQRDDQEHEEEDRQCAKH